MNSVLLDIIIKGKGLHIPRYPQLILGDGKKYLQGDILDANAVVTEIDDLVAKIIDAAPEALDTLKEIADSLHGDADIAGTLISKITDVENTVAELADSQATTITELTSGITADIAALQTGKVDAVSGKKLSTEDYTTAEKNKLAGIEAGALVNPTNVSAFTNDAGYLTAHQSLVGYATEVWVSNQGFLTEHQDISNKANVADIPTKTSDLTNDSGFLTQHQDISGKANTADLATVATSGSYNDLTNKPDFDSMLNNAGFVTQADFNDAVGIDTEGLQELKAILSDDDTTTGLLNAIDSKADKTSVESIATQINEINQQMHPNFYYRYDKTGDNTWLVDNQGRIVACLVASNANDIDRPRGCKLSADGTEVIEWVRQVMYDDIVQEWGFIRIDNVGPQQNAQFTISVNGNELSYDAENGGFSTTLTEYPESFASILSALDQKVDKEDMLETITDTVTETVSTEDANGHEYVEIGGIKWATMNVGASSETDYGNYYQYGKGAAQYATTNGSDDYSGTEDPLATSADTAAQVWGGTWRMPTKAEFESLIANTNYTWETNFNDSGVNGGKFTDKIDSSKYVFFAAAGDYSGESLVGNSISGYLWSSTPDGNKAYYVLFYNGVTEIRSDSRRYGNSIRGVLDSVTTTVETTIEHKVDKYVTKNYLEGKEVNNNGHAYVDLGLPSGTLWATMNVGASDEIEVGNYYMHGYGSSTFEPLTLTGPAPLAVLTSATDTATCVWGGDWITPGSLQFAELLANTTYLWMSDFNGVAGIKYTAKNGTGNYIFIPAGGFLVPSGATASIDMVWSMTSVAGTLFISYPNNPPSTAVNSTEYGYNVRPVICAAYAKKYEVTNAISGLHRVATTGSYTDLINRPSIPAAQIQSDWNLTNTYAKDYIKNKPALDRIYNAINWVEYKPSK